MLHLKDCCIQPFKDSCQSTCGHDGAHHPSCVCLIQKLTPGEAWLFVEISLKPLLTPDKWANLSQKMHILYIFLHTLAYYLTYSAQFAYYNMQNMQNMNPALIFLHISFAYSAYYFAYVCINMQNKMQTPKSTEKTRTTVKYVWRSSEIAVGKLSHQLFFM